MDVLFLSRLQFALTIMFHYLFPPLSIGLGLLMVIMEGLYLKTKNPVYEAMTKFWTKIFAVNFAMGVASGIVMEFQFGTNWATYSRYVGDVFGSALAAEGIFAFFLESGFLAVLVFGWDKVSPKMHFFSTCMVFLGSVFSAVWIVVANSWMQTPAGFHIVGEGLNARAEITDFWAMVFNPSSMHRLNHVLLGAFIMGAFFVMSIASYYILKGRHLDFAKRSLALSLLVGAVASVAVALSGHQQAQMVAEYQPAKMAAYEGHFQTSDKAPLHLFGFPDETEGRVKAGIAVPGLLSWLIHGDVNGTVTGLNDIPRDEWPPVALAFQTYHVMVALGSFFIAITFAGLFFLWRGTLFRQTWLLRTYVIAVIGAVIANQSGWIAAEVGRQPWIVHNLLKTSEALSKTVQANQVLGSIIMFTLIYALLTAVWLYVVDHKIKAGPDDPKPGPAKTSGGGWLDAAARLGDPAGDSLTEAREPRKWLKGDSPETVTEVR